MKSKSKKLIGKSITILVDGKIVLDGHISTVEEDEDPDDEVEVCVEEATTKRNFLIQFPVK